MHPTFPQETFVPSRILFKRGALADLSKEVAEFSGPGLIVHGASLEKSGLKEKIEKLKQEMRRLAVLEVDMLATPDQQISLTDPDARWFRPAVSAER